MFIIPINQRGRTLAHTIQQELGGQVIALNEVKAVWGSADSLLFIGALGICVRTIAPLLADKHTDPGVVCMDTLGMRAVAVASGHVGGANDLARRVARVTGGEAVVTTQSDCTGTWPLDTLARQFGWTLADDRINEQIALFVAGQPTALLLTVRDQGTDWMQNHLPENVSVFTRLEDIDQRAFGLLIAVSPIRLHGVQIPLVQYIPRVVHLGIGLAHQAQPAGKIIDGIVDSIEKSNIPLSAVASFSTISAKRDEPVVQALLAEGWEVRFYEADALKDIPVPNPSDTVARHMQTPSVSEASAVLTARGGPLVMEKQKGTVWTVAAALDRDALRSEGRIEIVGAGPGDSELISVRGQRLLAQADLILYAGSLVPQALTEGAKAGCVVRSSAGMDLEEQFALMREHYDRGGLVVRLHTGDPCLYGAIEEQMALMDKHGMRYRITPGISAFQAAAAELQSQFTIPQRVQTIILTRGEGRTPMPPREQLHLLARSRSTMCIYLSADIVEKVQAELLQEYPADTPVAVCYRLTWPQQRILRGRLADMANMVRDNGLTLHTLLVVGEAIGNRQGTSNLYSSHFTHLFRKATDA